MCTNTPFFVAFFVLFQLVENVLSSITHTLCNQTLMIIYMIIFWIGAGWSKDQPGCDSGSLPHCEREFPNIPWHSRNNGYLSWPFQWSQRFTTVWRSTRCFAKFASSLMSLTCSMAGARVLGTQRLRRLPLRKLEVMDGRQGFVDILLCC